MSGESRPEGPAPAYWRRLHARLRARLRRHPWICARSLDELRDELRIVHRNGLLDLQGLGMLEGVFNLARLRASEIMIPRSHMKVVAIDASREDVIQQIVEYAHSRYPVIDGDRGAVEGVLLSKDVLTRIGQKPEAEWSVRELMVSPFTLPENRRLTSLLGDFQQKRLHMGIVVNEYGEASGLVTIEDVIEEIVGEIVDEHDSKAPLPSMRIRAVGGGHHELEASVLLEDFCKHFDIAVPEPGVRTVGSLVARHSGHVPQVGEQVQVGDFRFTVTRMSGRRIRRLDVVRLPAERPGA